MLDFGRWIVEVAVNGVKSGSFDRAWAAMQLGNHYSRDRITAEDIARFDEEMNEYEAACEVFRRAYAIAPTDDLARSIVRVGLLRARDVDECGVWRLG